MFNTFFYSFCLLVVVSAISCNPSKEPIYFGKDNCAYCEMLIADSKFGAELVTEKGKIFKFDSIECLAAYFNKGREVAANVHSLWFINFAEPQMLIDLNNSSFIFSNDIKSPMGLSLFAVVKNNADNFRTKFNGKLMTWNEVKDYVKKEWD